MGDGGDSRDSRGYSVDRKVVAILPRGKFLVEGRFSGDKPEVFKINADGDWLQGEFGVFAINNVRAQVGVRSDAAIAREDALITARLAKKAAKFESDWTKGTIDDLKNIIDSHYAKEGKRVRGLSTAKKPALIEFIRKQGIRE
jgi:hypothetical protein